MLHKCMLCNFSKSMILSENIIICANVSFLCFRSSLPKLREELNSKQVSALQRITRKLPL
jgi:hypothetical protein